jgi:hypothetical protein
MLTELERRAWDTRSGADKHKPEMALKAALDDMSGRIPLTRITHAIVLLIHDEGDDFTISTYQAGELNTLAVEGAMARATLISQSGE